MYEKNVSEEEGLRPCQQRLAAQKKGNYDSLAIFRGRIAANVGYYNRRVQMQSTFEPSVTRVIYTAEGKTEVKRPAVAVPASNLEMQVA